MKPVICFATVVSIPCLILMTCRAWPSGETSGPAVSTLLRLMLRLASRPMTISASALILNWSAAASLISFFSSTISDLDPLKSKRLASSLLAWLTAFSISIELTCETMSKEGMAQFMIYDLRFCPRAQILNQSGARSTGSHLRIEQMEHLCQFPADPGHPGEIADERNQIQRRH